MRDNVQESDVTYERFTGFESINQSNKQTNNGTPPGRLSNPTKKGRTCTFKNEYRDGALAVESVHADIVVVLEVAAIEEPADGGVGDRFGAARQIDQMIVPGPGLTHRRQGK